ncbi:preprotein translocase subunit SecE [Pseudoflavonifractor sp. 524-17]|uniref:preprotein translocase subunit SecE n=1 Tax=Pseudoflavonifractor sp. 524-17 TaxID=2304577 RepID=UPI00137A68F8|nr:preprotein translocase subunit SecE [Pseudoflavonifractor sp. 524-17]NCE63284.1 preprotein translocase subunit SecE [Pseudoflavonifractor sp. 524-17]
MPENEKANQASEKSEKTKKSKKDKPGFGARAGKWFREMKAELKKVQWPTKKQTINNTVIVIVCCVVVGVCIWLFDTLASAVFKALINLFNS